MQKNSQKICSRETRSLFNAMKKVFLRKSLLNIWNHVENLKNKLCKYLLEKGEKVHSKGSTKRLTRNSGASSSSFSSKKILVVHRGKRIKTETWKNWVVQGTTKINILKITFRISTYNSKERFKLIDKNDENLFSATKTQRIQKL